MVFCALELLEFYGFKTRRNHDLEEEARERQELLGIAYPS